MGTKIGKLLVERGVISEEKLKLALDIQREGDAASGIKPGELLGAIITRKNLADPMEVVRTLCEQRHIENYLLIGSYIISPSLVAKFPLSVARRYHVIPLVCLDDSGSHAICATDKDRPHNGTAEIEEKLGLRIEWVHVNDPLFSKTLDRVYALMAERGSLSVRIGEVLMREGLITQDELEWALEISRRTNKRIGRVLIEEGLVVENDFYEMLSRHKRVPLVKAGDILEDKTSRGIAAILSRTFAIFNEVVPFQHSDGVLSVAICDMGTDLSTLRKIYDCKDLSLYLVTQSDMITLLKAFYELTDSEAKQKGLDNSSIHEDVELIQDVWEAGPESALSNDDVEKLRRQYEKLVSNLLYEAIQRRASDIHIECYENFVVVRLRIDGLLYDARTLRIDKTNVSGILNVIKILSDINIAERRLPQGGRFKKRTAAGEVFDFRVQVQPTLFGENVVVRLLNQTASIAPLSELGFTPGHRERFVRASKSPSGLILITGPTGSGKTTTLYSTLDLLRKDTTKKIVTIEDPIEYSLPRIQQSQTHETIGYTFASATRSFLRLDPDVALVGEIRDEETARETIKLSQTGHIVFSTLHTNTAVSAAGRLLVLGVDPQLLASELLVVAAQRLTTRICPECKVDYDPAEEVLRDFYPMGVPPGMTFYRGAGCESCEGLGHTGRVALVEFWFVDQESRLLITRKADEDEIIDKTLGKSLFPIVADALNKVEQGIVDIGRLPTVLPMSSIFSTTRIVQERGLLGTTRRMEAAG